MKPMNLVAGLAGGLAVLVLAGCGGGGGGMVRTMPEAPTVTAPASSRVEPDPAPADWPNGQIWCGCRRAVPAAGMAR